MNRLRRYLSAAASLAVVLVVQPTGTAPAATSAASSWGRSPLTAVQWSSPDALTAGTGTSTSTQQYKFSSVVAGKPVRWNPCAPIHWQFRSTNAPRGSGGVVFDAVRQVSAATGIPFVYDGATTATPGSGWLPTSTDGIRPLLIGWTDGSHSDLLRGRPNSVLGITRTAYFGVVQDGVTVAATKAAVIALNRMSSLPLTGSVSWHSTVLHELGHAMGLDHVHNTRELMYPVLQRGLYGLQPGDRAGLARLGRGAGCIDLGF